MDPRLRLALAFTLAVAVLGLLSTALLFWSEPLAAQDNPQPTTMESGLWAWGLFSAALATGLSSLAAGFAVGRLGTAAIGALAEKPELFGRLLVFVGLAEGIAIYGLIVSILILERLG